MRSVRNQDGTSFLFLFIRLRYFDMVCFSESMITPFFFYHWSLQSWPDEIVWGLRVIYCAQTLNRSLLLQMMLVSLCRCDLFHISSFVVKWLNLIFMLVCFEDIYCQLSLAAIPAVFSSPMTPIRIKLQKVRLTYTAEVLVLR